MAIKARGESAKITPDAADSPFDPLKRGEDVRFKRARAYATDNVEVRTGEEPKDNTHIDPRKAVINEIRKITKLYEAALRDPSNAKVMNEYIRSLREVIARNDDAAVSILGGGIAAIATLEHMHPGGVDFR